VEGATACSAVVEPTVRLSMQSCRGSPYTGLSQGGGSHPVEVWWSFSSAAVEPMVRLSADAKLPMLHWGDRGEGVGEGVLGWHVNALRAARGRKSEAGLGYKLGG
jgi:hypothetical protein